MSRPIKTGLDYYPHDTDCSHDPKLRYIEAIHGLNGYAIYHKILEQIYDNSYYFIADDRWKVLFASDNKIDVERLKIIISDLVNEALFDSKIYKEYSVLTSNSIQKRYLMACDRRKEISLCEQYLCCECIDDYKNLINDDTNLIIVNINTQSKVKESKEKESNEIQFDFFWVEYHNITKKEKTDKEAALKYWKKLTETEKKKACDMINAYNNSINDKKYIKKARTYLADKNFNDEYINKGNTSTSGNTRKGGLVEVEGWVDNFGSRR